MNNCLEPRVALTLKVLADRHPALKLPFIVTLAPGAKPVGVVPFVPTQEAELIRMAAGEMTAREALDLAAHPKVERIEYDGRAEALEALVDGS